MSYYSRLTRIINDYSYDEDTRDTAYALRVDVANDDYDEDTVEEFLNRVHTWDNNCGQRIKIPHHRRR